MLKRIKRSIEQHGFHLYIVTGGPLPRFAYTIGFQDALGAELVLAGAIYYSADEVKQIVRLIGERLRAGKKVDSSFPVDKLGSFTLRKAHPSWVKSLLLGALDYYKSSEIGAYQIVPDKDHWTVDIPDLGEEWSAKAEPIWQWLHQEWSYPVSPKSMATTNLAALRGSRITEATRWKADEWELFAGPGPDVSFEEARVVPLGSLLAADPSLTPVLNLEMEKGLWRESEGGDWEPWGKESGTN
jgi:hypothetical protein